MAAKNTKTITVTHGQVHVSRNPDVNVISVSDSKSANGFSSFPVFANEVSEFGDNRRSVITIDLDRPYDISRKDVDGKYEHDTVSGEDIVNMFEAAKSKAIANAAKTAKEAAPVEPTVPNAFMNRVSDKLIHNTKKAGLMRVSLPDEASNNGMANILVPSSNIFQSTRRGKDPIVGMKNINLGLENEMIKYSIVGANGKFIQMEKTAKEVSELWAESQAKFLENKGSQIQSVPEPVAENTAEAGDYGYGDDESF